MPKMLSVYCTCALLRTYRGYRNISSTITSPHQEYHSVSSSYCWWYTEGGNLPAEKSNRITAAHHLPYSTDGTGQIHSHCDRLFSIYNRTKIKVMYDTILVPNGGVCNANQWVFRSLNLLSQSHNPTFDKLWLNMSIWIEFEVNRRLNLVKRKLIQMIPIYLEIWYRIIHLDGKVSSNNGYCSLCRQESLLPAIVCPPRRRGLACQDC